LRSIEPVPELELDEDPSTRFEGSGAALRPGRRLAIDPMS